MRVTVAVAIATTLGILSTARSAPAPAPASSAPAVPPAVTTALGRSMPTDGPVGTAVAPDGQRVFVVRSGRTVTAFASVPPHAGTLGREVGWCPEQQGFVDASTGRTYDLHGRGQDGRGLLRYATTVVDWTYHVGAALEPVSGTASQPSGPRCEALVYPQSDRLLTYPDLIAERPDKVVAVIEGVLTVSRDGSPLLCEGFQGRRTCDPADALPVHGLDRTTLLDGRSLRVMVRTFRVRLAADGVHDLAVLDQEPPREDLPAGTRFGYIKRVTGRSVFVDEFQRLTGDDAATVAALDGEQVPVGGFHYVRDRTHELVEYRVTRSTDVTLGSDHVHHGSKALRELRAALKMAGSGPLETVMVVRGGRLVSLMAGVNCG